MTIRDRGAVDRLRTTGTLSALVARRNVDALGTGAWLVLVTGFVEPLLYLLSIGVGLGSVIEPIALAPGRSVDYSAFVAPAMLASYAMSSALAETTFVFVGRLRYLRVYDAMLSTPVRPIDIALGELGWATVRVTAYAAAFLAIVVTMGDTTPLLALAALPVVVLSAVAFGCLGILAATLVRDWRDFDALALVQFAMFMFGATFSPVDAYPAALRWLAEITPLYQAVSLTRAVTTHTTGWPQLVNVGYLLAVSAVGLRLASSRIGRLLCP